MSAKPKTVAEYVTITSSGFLPFTGIWLVEILALQQKYNYQKPLLDPPTVWERLGKS